MARWPTGTRERLEHAALDLFLTQGFAATTVPQITARAGLTTRTFFRHYADKREVLFGNQEAHALIEELMTHTPLSVSPMTLITTQLAAYAERVFGGRRAFLRLRHQIVATDQGLQERELQKLADLKASLVRGFERRGADLLTATLAAELAMAVLATALQRWLAEDSGQPLGSIVEDTLQALRALAADLLL